MSAAVALNGGGNEEELRDDDADDTNTSTIRLMLSQPELEGGDGESSGETEGSNTPVPLWLALLKCVALIGLMYGPFIGLIFSFSVANATLAWLLGAACMSVSLCTFSWMMCALIGKCRRDPACRDIFLFILQVSLFLVVTGVTFFGSGILHALFAMYAFSGEGIFDGSPPRWLWTTLLLLSLQFVVCALISVIGEIYLKRLSARPSIEGAAHVPVPVSHLALSLFINGILMFGIVGIMVDLMALIFWTVISPVPAIAWVAPASILAANAWVRSREEDQWCACWMRMTQRLSAMSVAAQFELANSSIKNYGAFATTTDAFHDDGTDTDTTISSEIV